MKLVSATIEQMLLMCILQTRNPLVRSYILSETTAEDYGTTYGKEIRKRMDVLLSLGKNLGGAAEFAEDPALSKPAAEFIKGTAKKRVKSGKVTKDRATSLVDRLRFYRNMRTLHTSIKQVNDLAVGNVDEAQMEKMTDVMEKTLVQVRAGFEKQPLTHMGKKQTDAEARKILEDLTTFVPGQFVSTGLPGLDRLIYGYERGNLVTYSATRGGGKSTMAMVSALNQYMLTNHNVCYVSMEMTKKEFWRRTLANLSQVPHDTIRYPKYMSAAQRKQVGKAWKKFHKHGHRDNCTFSLWNPNDSRFTPQKMEAALAPFMYDVIVVDYITLFYTAGMKLWDMQLEYSRFLKQMAMRLNCVVVVLTQLNEEERVKYGKSIEENTDYWMWWRYGDEEKETGDVELKLAKARHTASQRLMAKFLFDIMRIETQDYMAGSTDERGASGKPIGADSDIFTSADDF